MGWGEEWGEGQLRVKVCMVLRRGEVGRGARGGVIVLYRCIILKSHTRGGSYCGKLYQKSLSPPRSLIVHTCKKCEHSAN